MIIIMFDCKSKIMHMVDANGFLSAVLRHEAYNCECAYYMISINVANV